MKKGISEIISVIIIVLIAVSVTGLIAIYLLNSTSQVTKVDSSLNQSYLRSKACLSIDSVNPNSNEVTVRNCGKVPLDNLKIFVDSNEISISPAGEIKPMEKTVINFKRCLPSKDYYFYATANLAESPAIKVNLSLAIISIDSPITIDQNDGYYCLSSDIQTSSTAITFEPGVNNVTLDCDGHEIKGDGSIGTYGIFFIGSYNNTIENCNIKDFDYGIHLADSSNNYMTNISSTDNNYGAYFNGSYENNLINSNLMNNQNYDFYVLPSSDIDCNNQLINVVGTENKPISYFNGSVTISGWNNNASEIVLCNADNSNINNLILKRTAGFYYNNGLLLVRSNYVNINNANLSNLNSALLLYRSSNNIVNNTAINSSYTGMNIFEYSRNNIITNSKVTYNTNGISLSSVNNYPLNNSVSNCSVYYNSYDYYLGLAGSTNNFTNTNFTNPRSIYFGNPIDLFNYRNGTSNIWLKTKLSEPAKLTRKLINWNNTLMIWNETSNALTTAIYNITGLLTNTIYNVYNNSVLISGSPFNSGSSGKIDFTINLPSGYENMIKINNTTVSASSFVLWFNFNEANGTRTYDSSGNGNDGTFYGETFNDGTLGNDTCDPGSGVCPSRVSANNGYFSGKALDFDGSNDYTRIPLSSDFDFADQDFSVGFWMRASLQISSYGYLFSKNYDSSNGVRWYGCSMIGSEAGNIGKIRCYLDDGTNAPYGDTVNSFDDNAWHYVVLVRNTTNNLIKIFVDGIQNVSFSDTAGSLSNMTASTRNSFYIGGRSDLDSDRFFNGDIDEFRVWDRSLNITEIQSEMRSSLPVTRPAISWRFEEPSSARYVNDTHIWVNGTYGPALSFDGVNDYVNILDSNSLNITNEMTIAAWIYPLTNQSTGGSNQLVTRLNWNNNQGFFLREGYNQSHTPRFYVGNGTCGTSCWQYATASSISTNAWHYITGTVKANDKIRIYVDGNLSEENNYLGIINQSTGNVYIGWESGTKTFNGTIDEVRIWNRTLSEIEIQAEMTKG
ncbi:hypothetical protein A3K64_00875 [Candidatus Micrarchaeota archaeon RBG_16_36_9]|nr:MAG: hypothetical protein A3K64_00875 [Candidatus Micrarchaeota archaeon RBG_16_36_9]